MCESSQNTGEVIITKIVIYINNIRMCAWYQMKQDLAVTMNSIHVYIMLIFEQVFELIDLDITVSPCPHTNGNYFKIDFFYKTVSRHHTPGYGLGNSVAFLRHT